MFDSSVPYAFECIFKRVSNFKTKKVPLADFAGCCPTEDFHFCPVPLLLTTEPAQACGELCAQPACCSKGLPLTPPIRTVANGPKDPWPVEMQTLGITITLTLTLRATFQQQRHTFQVAMFLNGCIYLGRAGKNW